MQEPININYKKLSTIPEWYNLEDAALYISERLNIKFNESQILKLALDKKKKFPFTLSVYLLSEMMAYPCQFINAKENESSEEVQPSKEDESQIPSRVIMPQPNNIEYTFETFLITEGLYDLPLIGSERYTVHYKLLEYMKEPVVQKYHRRFELSIKTGTYIKDVDGQMYCLHQPMKYEGTLDDTLYSPENCLPKNSILAVRTSVLQELVDALAGEEPGKDNQLRVKEEKANLAKVLDPAYPWHSERLALAINTWVKLFGNRTDSPSEFKPSGGNVKFIEEWLKKNKPNDLKLSPTATLHMAEFINPDKSKGPRKTKTTV